MDDVRRAFGIYERHGGPELLPEPRSFSSARHSPDRGKKLFFQPKAAQNGSTSV